MMRSLFDQSIGETDTWSVSELTAYVREMFDLDYRLQDIHVTGEISNFSRARSGHVYFTLKDEAAQLRCVMWRTAADRIVVWPEDGAAVNVHGRISVYEAGGVYQLYADSLEMIGRGDLALAFELLKAELAAEGLFDPALKKPIPPFPQKLGIVTSPDAAALRDILTVLNRRWPMINVLIAPTLVQGREAPPMIVQALRWLDGRSDIDTIIVARGGGSMEDLWAFNDEQVARVIASAKHPIIVGVGHETDFTIADFVADLRAPTPSAAAELAVPDQDEIQARLTSLQVSLTSLTQSFLSDRKVSVRSFARNLKHLSPQMKLDNSRQRIDGLVDRLDARITALLKEYRSRLLIAQTGLTAVSPMATLTRGYAIVRDAKGDIVRSISNVSSGDKIHIQVQDGTFNAAVE